MKKALFFLLVGLFSCQRNKPESEKLLYRSEAFSVYTNKVVQGKNVATIDSRKQISSNYKSPASSSYSRLIKFKFSINEKDNELPVGDDHWVLIGSEHRSPLVVFGEKPAPLPEITSPNYLPVNYKYTFRVDMSAVIKQFEKQGFYKTFAGKKIAKTDFKGFYIAGNSEPLSWDFVNLANKNLKLKPAGEGNIYEITIKLNPYNSDDYQEKTWQLSRDISHKAQYQSEQPIVDALYNLSLEEALKNIEPDSTLRTGAKWDGVWTRDISYSIFLAFAYHEPEIAKISLLKKVKRNRIIQDTGSGGAWPVSSDRVVWAVAAWELYKFTGEQNWLKTAYTIVKNSLQDDKKNIANTQTGLYRGESSFLDWREQTYPKWMSNADIYSSQNLATNVLHYQAHIILAKMAKELDKPHKEFDNQAVAIKKAINKQLWQADKGYYAQYLYGRNYLNISPRFEALGEALAVLFGVADSAQATQIFAHAPLTTYGVTCIYPQISGIPPYHNNAVWPFVQSYWNLAAAKAGNEQALNRGLAAIYRASALFLSNYENFVAQTGDFLGTEINSDRMLWSMAGNLAMVHRLFIGMKFQPQGIHFQPVIPKNYSGKKTLTNFRYRHAVLEISVNGFGNQIVSFKIDGKKSDKAFFPAKLAGKHRIEIEMNKQSFDNQTISSVKNHFTLASPHLRQQGNLLKWNAIAGATRYLIYRNGQLFQETEATEWQLPANETAEYKVSAVDSLLWESFTCEPLFVKAKKNVQLIEIEQFTGISKLPYSNYSGKGFVEVSNSKNKTIYIEFEAKEAGNYWLDFRYANGNGAWNTDNKCAIRSLWLDDEYVGVLVLPQRGLNEWSDWGFSNTHNLPLKKGRHTLKLSFENWNINMNGKQNKAMLDYMRLVKN